MNTRSGFQRSFFIFVNEDTGFESGQKPSGHVKIEVREGKGKLHAVAHNLRAGNDKFEYDLYLLHSGIDTIVPVRAGWMESVLGRFELKWNFDPGNVGGSGYSIEAFDIIAVLAMYSGRQKGYFTCPLAAYRNNRVQWRSKLAEVLLKMERQSSEDTKRTENCKSTINSAKTAGKTNENVADAIESIKTVGRSNENVAGAIENIEITGRTNENTADIVKNIKTAGRTNENTTDIAESIKTTGRTNENAADIAESIKTARRANENTANAVERTKAIERANKENIIGAADNTGDTDNIIDGVHQAKHEDTNFDENELKNTQSVQEKLQGDLTMLKAALDSNFEKSDPFRSKRSDYIWWNVSNPVNLNNILYQYKIPSPLMFNPAVMMAHYKYRHLIIGIFTHSDGREYVVCGVPGMYMVDRKPFGELCTWVQAGSGKAGYGTFGYWLVYINPEDGKILNPGR